MIAQLVRYFVLFFLPFVAYGAWLLVARRRSIAHQSDPGWSDAPLMWLTVAGMVLVVAGFVVFGLNQGEDRDGTYVPSSIQNGQIVPGEVQRGE